MTDSWRSPPPSSSPIEGEAKKAVALGANRSVDILGENHGRFDLTSLCPCLLLFAYFFGPREDFSAHGLARKVRAVFPVVRCIPM